LQDEQPSTLEPKQNFNHKRCVSNFKHSTGFLKRVARMSSDDDRKEILKIVKKQERKRKARKLHNNSTTVVSSTSESSKNSNSTVNKDWENWVVMNGKQEVIMTNVKEIGKVFGVSFNGDPNNSFNLLTKAGRRGWRAAGGVDVEGGDVEGVRGVGEGC